MSLMQYKLTVSVRPAVFDWDVRLFEAPYLQGHDPTWTCIAGRVVYPVEGRIEPLDRLRQVLRELAQRR